MAGELPVTTQDRDGMKLEFDSNKRVGRQFLELILNKPMRIVISDGRLLIGQFLCTDRDKNIILGSCQEYVGIETFGKEEPRMLGLAMVPGRHVVSMHVDIDDTLQEEIKNIEMKLDSIDRPGYFTEQSNNSQSIEDTIKNADINEYDKNCNSKTDDVTVEKNDENT